MKQMHLLRHHGKGVITRKMKGLEYYDRGHRFYVTNGIFGYILCPKNANRATKQALFKINAETQRVSENIIRPQILTCTWRDPRTRILSGLGEFCFRTARPVPCNLSEWKQLLEKLYKSATSFDEHLEPQIVSAEGFYFDYVFRFEHLLDDMLSCEYLTNNIPDLSNIIKPEKTTVSQHISELSFADILNNNEDLISSIIEKYYSYDMKIFLNNDLIKDPNNIIRL